MFGFGVRECKRIDGGWIVWYESGSMDVHYGEKYESFTSRTQRNVTSTGLSTSP